ncbi:MAG TPA: molecular chaperone HtpG, partial [Alphaproteobacteria bacterium]|nr:molecular chaperone HtpG [Alphaproteobacteria bacterium]
PVCLVAGDNEVDLHLARVLKTHQNYESQGKRILEVNADHPLLRRMAGMQVQGQDEQSFKDLAFLLLDQARIAEGEPLPDPAAHARRLTSLILGQ